MVGANMKNVSPEDAKNINYSHLFKICLCGPATTGKSSVMRRFTNDSFEEEYLTTIGVDFSVKVVEYMGSEYLKLQIWDTAGQERYRTITNSYYRGAHGIVLFCDLTNRQSFEDLHRWIEEVVRYSSEDLVMMIAASKSDMTEERTVTEEELSSLAKGHGLDYMEVSAKTGENVFDLFEMMVGKMIYSKRHVYQSGHSTAMSTMVGNFANREVGKTARNSDGLSAKKSKTCVLL